MDKVLDLLHFYFSDENLSRDSFLRKRIEESNDRYVPIDLLLTFNKLKTLSCTFEDLQKCIVESHLLEVCVRPLLSVIFSYFAVYCLCILHFICCCDSR